MPPQQSERLLDLVDEALDFCAHIRSMAAEGGFSIPCDGDLTSQARRRNIRT
jgi:hypothetical protein